MISALWNNKGMRRGVRALRSHFLNTTDETIPWKYEPDRSVFSGGVNTDSAERLSGIHHKIAQIRAMGSLTIVGGLTTDGNDGLFYENWLAALGRLQAIMAEVPKGGFLLLYPPHPFWARILDGRYQWLPSWRELYEIFDGDRDWSVFQYSPSFDAAGRYFFIAHKQPSRNGLPPESILAQQNFCVFFHPGGADLSQGNSSRALSAHLCAALMNLGANVASYSMMDVSAVSHMRPEDILIGHVGPWVRAAYERGTRRIILYNPANRWYPTRNLPDLEVNATMAEQVEMSQMVIAQSGAIWRLTGDYPQSEKWRWIDLGVDPILFPRLKSRFNPPGRRRFCFIHLYDSEQKGSDIAKAITQARPDFRFYWIAGQPFSSRNVRFFSQRPNTSRSFREAISQCDYLLTPSLEDAQPGTVVEAMSIGLIPALTYTSGYSVSYPRLVEPNSLEEWLKIVDFLQQVPEEELLRRQAANDLYLSNMHNWNDIENQILFYLGEFLQREILGERTNAATLAELN